MQTKLDSGSVLQGDELTRCGVLPKAVSLKDKAEYDRLYEGSYHVPFVETTAWNLKCGF
jgi:hypothetical protein